MSAKSTPVRIYTHDCMFVGMSTEALIRRHELNVENAEVYRYRTDREAAARASLKTAEELTIRTGRVYEAATARI